MGCIKSDRRQDEELESRIGKARAVMWALHYLIVMKREFSEKAKLSRFKTVFVTILTYGNESWVWVMTKRERLQVQVSEMRFLSRIQGVTLFDKMCISDIEPLLFWIERSQLDSLAMYADRPWLLGAANKALGLLGISSKKIFLFLFFQEHYFYFQKQFFK